MKGFEWWRIQHRIGSKVDRVQALVDWSHKGQKKSASSLHPPPRWGAEFLQNSKISIRLWCIFLEKELGLLSLNYCFLTAFPLFLCSLTSLKTIITETCSRASLVMRLRSQNAWGQNERKPCLVLLLRGLLPSLLPPAPPCVHQPRSFLNPLL